MPDLVLSKDEMIEFTRYKKPSKQIKWLERYGIPYRIGGDGHPVVLRADLAATTAKATKSSPNPNALAVAMRRR